MVTHLMQQLGYEAADLLPKVTECIAHIEETLIMIREYNNHEG